MLTWEHIASAEFVDILRKKTVSKKTVSVVVIFHIRSGSNVNEK